MHGLIAGPSPTSPTSPASRYPAAMKHAGAATLQALESLLARMRALPGLVERTPGCFYKGSSAFLHFHEDASGAHADLKLSADGFTRVRAETAQERDALVALAAKALETLRP